MARKSRKNLPQPEQAAVSVLLPELEEAKIPAAIYGRLSVEDEEKEESMETQIALVQDYISRSRELSYVDTYFDNGFTGTNFKRPAFTRLMNDVRQKKIKCIVVKDLSRLGKDGKDEFDGSAGFAKMQSIMQTFRGGIKEFGGKRVVKLLDYAPGLDGLPKSDVLKFLLEDNCSIVVRPSGTEPKLKTYISISAENKETAEKIEAEICKSAEEYLK